jgi:hypothetical protein
MDETCLREIIALLKHHEQELDAIAWRTSQAANALRHSARLDERCVTPRLRKADRVKLTEASADHAAVAAAFQGISRARLRLERFQAWLMMEPGQQPLPFPASKAA